MVTYRTVSVPVAELEVGQRILADGVPVTVQAVERTRWRNRWLVRAVDGLERTRSARFANAAHVQRVVSAEWTDG